MLDHHQQLQIEHNICSCDRVPLLVLDFSRPPLGNTASNKAATDIKYVLVESFESAEWFWKVLNSMKKYLYVEVLLKFKFLM